MIQQYLSSTTEESSGLRYEKSFQKKLQLCLDLHRYLLSVWQGQGRRPLAKAVGKCEMTGKGTSVCRYRSGHRGFEYHSEGLCFYFYYHEMK